MTIYTPGIAIDSIQFDDLLIAIETFEQHTRTSSSYGRGYRNVD